MDALNRSSLLIGNSAMQKLAHSKVMVVGLGGVGGFVVEALARSGIGHLVLVDFDTVDQSNFNRQLIATSATLHRLKTESFKQRIESIYPLTQVTIYSQKYADWMIDDSLDYIIDAMDDVASKIELIYQAQIHNIPLLTVCGTARKTDPTQLFVTRLDKTENDPLAKAVRVGARKKGYSIKHKAIYSKETPVDTIENQPLPSMIFVPASAGLLAAKECIFDICFNKSA